MLDIERNRASQKWTAREQFGRVLWAAVTPLFRLSPRQIWFWRVALLRLFGATVGRNARIFPSVRIAIPWNLRVGDWSAIGDRVIIYDLGTVTLGTAVTVSQGAHICAGTHDYRAADMPLVKSPIEIGDGAWICADAFIGPGVSVGDYAIVGARAVATGDIEAWNIVAGNPCKVIGMRTKPV
jgi:putative colanic acid biosynthesis acetyltransferase WcaF